MHIKSIFVDGFKSYAKRTEITGFDPEFNAITGLNGSGKSNILDAICFLLGITNLSQVRAANLQDLVYKCGQAGVTKATVSIIFDNKVKSASPIGYESFDELTITRQIVIGGKNKYLINGITAQNNRVQDLFRSVQLNVNNPHFLIMQGRITKVLNMKPPEILSLLEEAASTKHYEAKRENTLATIEKKDGKLKEIDKVLREEIKPTLAKLKLERSNYIEYQKVIRELEYLNKLVVAHDYTKKQAIVDNADGELARLIEQQSQAEQTIVRCDRDKAAVEATIVTMCGERDALVEKRDETHLEWSAMQKDEVILKNAIKRAEDELKAANVNLVTLKKQSVEDCQTQERVRDELAKIEDEFVKKRRLVEEARVQFDAAQQRLQEVNSGFFVSESGNATGSLAELVAAAENDEANLGIELNIQRMKMAHLTKVVDELMAKLRGMKKPELASTQESKHQQIMTRINELEKKIAETGFSNQAWEAAQNDKSGVIADLHRSQEDKRNFVRANRRLEFEYRRPANPFDDRKIIGMVASLIELENTEFGLALETAAGARLYNIIVEDERTCARLLNEKCLFNRTTLLPLDKMQSSPLPVRFLENARRILGPDNVWSPMQIVKFDRRYLNAIEYVLGGCLIARDLNMAKIVAFDRQIGCRCVTLDGEVFDPEGTLAGGSQLADSQVIVRAGQLRQYEVRLAELAARLTIIDGDIVRLDEASERHAVLTREWNALQIKLRELERQMRSNDYLEVQQNMKDTQLELDTIVGQNRDKTSQHEAACARTREAMNNLANCESVKELAQKKAAFNVKEAQDKLTSSENQFKDVEFRHESLTLELTENENDQQTFETVISDATGNVEKRKGDVEHSRQAGATHTDKMRQFRVGLEASKKAVRDKETQVDAAHGSVLRLIKTKDAAAVKLSDVNHLIVCHKKDSEDAEVKLAKMLRKYNWIVDERAHFGEPGGIYNFATKDWRDVAAKIDQLEEEKKRLSRKVDLRGMNMLGQTEERYNDLMTKYDKVLQDKHKLQTVIDELDKRKDEVIKKAHEQVDLDFNKIFSTLLPGSQARLSPPNGKSLSDGLEFKIAFGNVWKESLSELSGGQRSLVALSLILALLRFRPAPLYILDEVDAALDISHTQNIGTIIKEQFSNSQFIIVSLKDGMFNNANVLFKTKFVDGVSTVTRHVNTARRPMAEKNL